MTFVALASIALNACSTIQDAYLDTRLAGPCERVLMSWPARLSELDALIDDSLQPQSVNNEGHIQLEVTRCGPASRSSRGHEPLQYAYVGVPLAKDSVPMAITSVPPENWNALSAVVVDKNSRPVFYEFGFPIVDADITFDIAESGGAVSLRAVLQFDAGRIVIEAKANGEPKPHDIADAVIDVRNNQTAAYFGKEASQRYSLTNATVRIEGSTPLSSLELPPKPTAIALDRELIPDRLYWGVPQSQR